MMIRLVSELPIGVLHERLLRFCTPLEKGNLNKKNVTLHKGSASRFMLVQNGSCGRMRPLRVFKGCIAKNKKGQTEITGAFSISLLSGILVTIPALLIVFGAFAVSSHLGWVSRLVFCLSAVFGVSMVFYFMSRMSKFAGTDNDKKLLMFLSENIAKGIDPQKNDDTT
ncbi:MAG: hypothetical protein FWH04_00480 [Oscillospiraceae bacterium]|nr:hypothetical protein [Oscillospiraceae bacterium]